MIPLFIVLAAIVAFLAVILIRTAMFKPKPQEIAESTPVEFDGDAAVEALRALIRCKTVSNKDRSLEDDAEFEKLIGLLPELYPHVAANCEMLRLPDRGILFTWKGKAHDAPAVMMAHYDVVSVEPENWKKPPFDAVLEDGIIWGRGTLDTKNSFNGTLFAADTLIAQGYVPANDIYMAFSGGEEVNGPGAIRIVEWFKAHNIVPTMVLDEGGAVVTDMFPGVHQPCGLIGISEKGMLNLEFSVASEGGHASAPAPHTPIGVLSAACEAVENHPFPFMLTSPVAQMFDTLGRYSTFVYRMIFANLWLFKGLLDALTKKKGGVLNALIRTTVAFTQADGSLQANVIPPSASFVANMRLNPNDTVDGAIERIRGIIKNDKVKLTKWDNMNPPPVAETDCDAYRRIASAVGSTWNCIVAPYLMVQCSDSRHYADLCQNVYKFSAADMTDDERASLHGNNEHIRVETAKHAVEFYIRLMKQC